MTATRDTQHRLRPSGMRALSETELDHVLGGAGQGTMMTLASTGSEDRTSSAVGIHEITGALVKIN